MQALQGAIDEYCRRILRGIGGVLIRLSGSVEEPDRRRRIPQTLVRVADQGRRGRRADHARTCACEDRHRSGGGWGRVPRPLARLARRRRGGQAVGFLDSARGEGQAAPPQFTHAVPESSSRFSPNGYAPGRGGVGDLCLELADKFCDEALLVELARGQISRSSVPCGREWPLRVDLSRLSAVSRTAGIGASTSFERSRATNRSPPDQEPFTGFAVVRRWPRTKALMIRPDAAGQRANHGCTRLPLPPPGRGRSRPPPIRVVYS